MRTRIVATMLAAGLVGSPALGSDFEVVDRAPGAASTSLTDSVQWYADYVGYLQETHDIVCDPPRVRGKGTTEERVAEQDVYAIDVAASEAHCTVMPGVTRIDTYSLKTELYFEYYAPAVNPARPWIEIEGTNQPCQSSSLGGESITYCQNVKEYTHPPGVANAYVGFWHRACVKVLTTWDEVFEQHGDPLCTLGWPTVDVDKQVERLE